MEPNEKLNRDQSEPEAGSNEESESSAADVSKDSTAFSAASDSLESSVSTKKQKKKKDGLGTSRGIETIFRTSYRVHMNLSSLADAKANIMISINGLIISIIIAAISPKIDTNPWLLLPTTIMLLGSLISIVYAVRAARPRVSSQIVSLDDAGSKRTNILFFGHFTNMTEDEFVLGMSNLLSDQTSLYQNMIRDIYGLGQVLKRKFSLLRISYTVFMVGLILGILAFISTYTWIVISLGPEELSSILPSEGPTLLASMGFAI
ncbi:MAG: hypothetical protein BMS9Abin05_0266 [Rhodothermia bacterium]|nr:MAG: hypothetical protein BMS9Abin05_0266 [Rhodothermia bacterium]